MAIQASIMDVTGSIQYYCNTFAIANNLVFTNTSSIESVTTLMQEAKDQLILVQEKVDTKTFTTISYRLFVSFADTTDANSLKTNELLSQFVVETPRYKALCIYEYAGLKLPVSEYNETGIKFVVSTVEQSITSRAQMRNNLTSVTFSIMGVINIQVGPPTPETSKARLAGNSYLTTKAVRDLRSTSSLVATADLYANLVEGGTASAVFFGQADLQVVGTRYRSLESHLQAQAILRGTANEQDTVFGVAFLYGESQLDIAATVDYMLYAGANLSGVADISASGFIRPSILGIAHLSGSAIITCTLSDNILGSANLTGTADLQASSTIVSVLFGRARFTTFSIMNCIPSLDIFSDSNLSGSAVLSSDSTLHKYLSSHISGSADMTVTFGTDFYYSAHLDGLANLFVTGQTVAALSAEAHLSAYALSDISSSVVRLASSNLQGNAFLELVVSGDKTGRALLSGEATIEALSHLDLHTGSIIEALSVMIARATIETEHLATAYLEASANLLITAGTYVPGAATLSGSANMSILSAIDLSARAVLRTTSYMYTTAGLEYLLDASLSGEASLSVTSELDVWLSSSLIGEASMVSLAKVSYGASSILSGDAQLSSIASNILETSSNLSGNAQVLTTPGLLFQVSSSLEGQATLAIEYYVNNTAGQALLGGNAKVRTSASLNLDISVHLSGRAVTLARGFKLIGAEAALLETASMTAIGIRTRLLSASLQANASVLTTGGLNKYLASSLSAEATLQSAGDLNKFSSSNILGEADVQSLALVAQFNSAFSSAFN